MMNVCKSIADRRSSCLLLFNAEFQLDTDSIARFFKSCFEPSAINNLYPKPFAHAVNEKNEENSKIMENIVVP